MAKTNDEIKIPIAGGKQFLIFPSVKQNPKGVDYVRFEDENGNELLYYDQQEWADEPELVMGAIMACIQSGV